MRSTIDINQTFFEKLFYLWHFDNVPQILNMWTIAKLAKQGRI